MKERWTKSNVLYQDLDVTPCPIVAADNGTRLIAGLRSYRYFEVSKYVYY